MDNRPTSRLMSSVTTFGPVGRVVLTVIVLFPMILMLSFLSLDDATILGVLTYPVLMWVVLRDIWAPVRVGRREDYPDPIELSADPQTERAAEVIPGRDAPSRW